MSNTTFNAARLTLFAIISNLEIDLRRIISKELLLSVDLNNLVSDRQLEKIQIRAAGEYGVDPNEIDQVTLLDFLDYGDGLEILAGNKQYLTKDRQQFALNLHKKTIALVPIRNRVMHSRPLQDDDFTIAWDSCSDAVNQWREDLPHLSACLERIKTEPGYVLSLNLPTLDTFEERISHNLPMPDFDETGFIGRKNLTQDIIKLLYGAFPIVTLVGVGGIGKTALAVKTAYEIIDDEKCPFEAVVWVTSKTTAIGRGEVLQINDAITSSLGVFQEIGKIVGADITAGIDEIIEYMKEFKILLILDNLETVLDINIREFLRRIPTGSKVLITSRIGVGAYDHPLDVAPLEEDEAIKLLRILAKNRSVDILYKESNVTLQGHVRAMKSNPGFIKWFVTAVDLGERPERLLANPDVFLDFCMQNVHERLSADAKKVLDVMLSNTVMYPPSMLQYLTDISVTSLNSTLLELVSTNIVSMQRKEDTTVYKINDIPLMYLRKFQKPDTGFVQQVQRRRLQIIASEEKLKAADHFPYNINNVSCPSKLYVVSAKYLRDAMRLAKINLSQAISLVEKAKSLDPNYFEAYRVHAFLLSEEKNSYSANIEYSTAISLAPKYAPLRLWYAGFLSREMKDISAALEQLEAGEILDPASIDFKIEIARSLMYLHQYDKASKAIAVLNDWPGTVRERQARLIASLNLQYYRRNAEYLFEQGEGGNALLYVEQQYAYYIKCNSTVIDARNYEEMAKTLPILERAISVQYTNQGRSTPTKTNELLMHYRHIDRTHREAGEKQRLRG